MIELHCPKALRQRQLAQRLGVEEAGIRMSHEGREKPNMEIHEQ